MSAQFEVGEATFPRYSVVSVRTRDSLYAMGRLFGAVFAKARAAGRKPAGPPFCVYYEKPVDPQSVDYEVFLPVSGEADAAAGVSAIGGERCAYLRVKGSYSQFEAAYAAVGRHLEERKLSPSAPPREVYVRGPLLGILTFVPIMITDIYFPIA